MSESRGFPAELLSFALFGALGVAATAAALAGFAHLMAGHGCSGSVVPVLATACLLYTSDAADEEDSGDLGRRRNLKKKKNI